MLKGPPLTLPLCPLLKVSFLIRQTCLLGHGKDVAERKFKTDEEMFEAVRANLKLEKEEKTDHTDDVVVWKSAESCRHKINQG